MTYMYNNGFYWLIRCHVSGCHGSTCADCKIVNKVSMVDDMCSPDSMYAVQLHCTVSQSTS